MAAMVDSETRMFPWTATPGAVTPPAQGKQWVPLKVADCPCRSTMPTCRLWASGSRAIKRSMTVSGAMPSASIARPSGPWLVLAYDWVAIAPTPPLAQGTTAPAARNFEATATPHSPEVASAATMEKVLRRVTGGELTA